MYKLTLFCLTHLISTNIEIGKHSVKVSPQVFKFKIWNSEGDIRNAAAPTPTTKYSIT